MQSIANVQTHLYQIVAQWLMVSYNQIVGLLYPLTLLINQNSTEFKDLSPVVTSLSPPSQPLDTAISTQFPISKR